MSTTSPAVPVPAPPPATTAGDLLRLAGGVARAFARGPRRFELRRVLREWLRETAARRGSDDLVVNLGVTRLLVVGGRELSRHVLEGTPRQDGYVEGETKRKAMAVLAPGALTVAHGERWMRLRRFNELVLRTVDDPRSREAYLAQVRRAFARVVRSENDVRACMREANRGIVFGPGVASERLSRDVEFLSGLVQSPVKRIALGMLARTRRRRLYDELRRLWDDPAAAERPTLLGAARRHAPDADGGEALQQVPHWMFTFTGSGTDLLVRTLALVGSNADAWERARGEAVESSEAPEHAGRSGGFLEACLRESARLYPPVTRTFHRCPHGDTVGGVSIPPDMEIVHSFPLDDGAGDPGGRVFRPQRWLEPGEAARARAFADPFLGGARACPGEALIVFVCTAALRELLKRGVRVRGDDLSREPLPFTFPRELRFTEG
ncbi:MAG TPA: cytochrome P450 [Longimicrobium sp.]|nr:cytochrome P450 [Longimicrobium sp.]